MPSSPFPSKVAQTIDRDGNIIQVDGKGQISIVGHAGSRASPNPSSLPMMAVHNLNMEPAIEAMKAEAPVQFVKMEQLDASSLPLSTLPTTSIAGPSDLQIPAASSGQSRGHVKKRRSWGQELPEPTTNLPPRKRAKTDAEKEQRRIERVKRNRQAAHNSRERKRQEHEALEDECKQTSVRNKFLEQQVARLRQFIVDSIGKLPSDLDIGSPVIEQTDDTEVGSVKEPLMQSPFASPFTQADGLFTAAQLPLTATTVSSFSSETSTSTTPVLSNSSDFTSPATEPLPFTPTVDPLNLGQTRQFAVSPLGSSVDEVISFCDGPVGDFDLFGPDVSTGGITGMWPPVQAINIGSELLQESPLLDSDSDPSFIESHDSFLGEFIDLSEQSHPCATSAFRGVPAAGSDHAVEQS